ncbi:MAG: porin [Hydrogenobaculum sp.]
MKSKVCSLLLFSGLCILSHNANAILLKASNDEFAQVGLKIEIWAQQDGATYTNDHNSTNFSVAQTRLYFAGQINPIVQFGADLDFADNNTLKADGTARTHQGVPYTMVRDAFINLHFNKSTNIMAGLFLNPWSRYELEYTWSFYIPTENFIPEIGIINNDITNKLNPSQNKKPFITPLASFNIGGDSQFLSALRDMGVVYWGSIGKNAMLKYYAFIGNGKYDYQDGYNGNSNLKYGFRLEFTPTMLGYKGEPSYVDQDTYLGKRNTLTFGFGYQQQKIDCSGAWLNSNNQSSICANQTSSTTAKAYTFDVLWEQKFGNFVPNFQAAWLDQKDLGYAKAGNTIAQPEVKGYYLQTQLLYDKYIGIGKPAIAFRYEQDEDKNYYLNSNNIGFTDAKIGLFSAAVDYYISGLNANVGLEATRVVPNANLIGATANGNNSLKSFWDYTLALRTVF